jgi:4-alpha-glucanotransferase
MKRSSGILMPISALSSSYGIGTFGKEAYEFVDFLSKAGQKYWQILPLGQTGFGDSPYQCYSAFAGNPYFIDFRVLKEEGYLEEEDYDNIDFGTDESKIDYDKLLQNKYAILKKAFENNYNKERENIQNFSEENKSWLQDYALFMALKTYFNELPWQEWPEEIKLRSDEALISYSSQLKEEIDYWIFIQYKFYEQWQELKKYANRKDIEIIGDVPIYVSSDSSDTWANSWLFRLDENKRPITVSGCPPDPFAQDGQLWGNPIYDWEAIEKSGFKWWIERVRANLKLFDVIRIDHFRGFESYWEIPYGDKTAAGGHWVKGPGHKLFNSIKAALGEDVSIIAEDLGFLTDEVIKFREETGFPGMKVLQFAFNPTGDSDYLPYKHIPNCIVYTGTHDNDTANGWLNNPGFKKDVNFATKYLKLNKEEGENWGFIRGAWSSVANLAVAQMQDFLGIGSEGRINIPSTVGGNWAWRVKKAEINDELAEKIADMTELYGRLNK